MHSKSQISRRGTGYIALTTGGGNKYKTGIKLWAWQKDYGFTIEHDEAKAGLNILRNYADGIKPDPVGKTAFFISTTSGNVGIATTEPSLPLDVNGWIGSSSKDQTRDGWRLGRWPGNNAGNEWVYLSNLSGASYQNLAVGNLYVSGTITYKGKNLVFNNRFIPTAENLEAESDLRLKTDLNQIPNALERLKKLRGFTYRWNETGLRYFTRDIEHTLSAGPNATSGENRKLWQKERDKRCKELSRTNVGVIAQEVEAVLPEAVTTDESGYKSVNYYELIPLVIEALKEEDGISKGQSETIARQQAEIQRLTAASELALRQLNELREVKQKLARLEAAMSKLAGSGSSGDHNELISSAEGSKSNPGNTLDSH